MASISVRSCLQLPAPRLLPGFPALTSLNDAPCGLTHTNPFSPSYLWSWCLSQQQEAQRDSVSGPGSCSREISRTRRTPVESEPCISGKSGPKGPKGTQCSSQSSKDPERPCPAHWLSTENQFSRLFPRSRLLSIPCSGCRPPPLPHFPTSHLLQLGPRHNWEAAGAGRGVQQLRP